jgi:hypothetical protein
MFMHWQEEPPADVLIAAYMGVHKKKPMKVLAPEDMNSEQRQVFDKLGAMMPSPSGFNPFDRR